MPLKIGLFGVSHVHAPSYVWCCDASPLTEMAGVWDADSELAARFANSHGLTSYSDRDSLLADCEAIVVAGTNMEHADMIEMAVAHDRPVLCEKPIAASTEQLRRIQVALDRSKCVMMTAFPCPYSPTFESAMAKIEQAAIGTVLSVCATNHGKCPFGWFVDKAQSGGGAMIDHVVHVADILWRIVGSEPENVHAVTGNNMYGQDWEDSAVVTLSYPNGVFATIDSSWSRPKSYKAWGDVTLKIIGDKGVIELDLFVQAIDAFVDSSDRATQIGFGTNLDLLMVEEFARCVASGRAPRTSLADGLAASRVALSAYESASKSSAVTLI